MSTNEKPAPQPSEMDNIAKILETLVAKLANDEQKSISEKAINLSGNLIFQDLQKLDNINWEKWSRQTIRNLRGYDLLHLFEGLEETDFKEAMQIEKSSRQHSMDEANAMAIIRAGLTEDDKKLVCDAENAKECWTLLKGIYNQGSNHRSNCIFADLDDDLGREWKTGDKATFRWYYLRKKISNYQGMESLSTEPKSDNFLARLVIRQWVLLMPKHIANVFNKHVNQPSGYWKDVMEKIDCDLESVLKGNPSNTPNESASKARRDRRREGPKCDWCKKFGHTEDECHTKKKQSDKIIRSNASIVEKTATGTRTPSYWIVDSGSTDNLTGDLTKIHRPKNIDPIPVYWGGLQLETRTLGYAKINVGGFSVVTEVYFVDGLNQNLLSVKRICKQGIKVVAEEEGAYISKGSRRTYFDETGNLYTLPYTGIDKQMEAHMTYQEAHEKFGHAGEHRMRQMRNQSADKNYIQIDPKPLGYQCQSCTEGKITKTNGHSHTLAAQEPLDLIHMDVSGNHPIGLNMAKYYIILVDDASKYKWVIAIQNRREIANILNEWKRQIELKMGKTIKAFRTDNAPELKKLTLEWKSKFGSEAQFTIPGTSSQNGVAERAIRTINDSIRTLLVDSSMPTRFWPYAAVHAAYLANRADIKGKKSPFEMFYSIAPSIMHIHRWGCKVIFHKDHSKKTEAGQGNKFRSRGKDGILLSIDENVLGRYTIWDIEKGKPVITESLKFFHDTPGGTLLEPTETSNQPQFLIEADTQMGERNTLIPEQHMEIMDQEEVVKEQCQVDTPEIQQEIVEIRDEIETPHEKDNTSDEPDMETDMNTESHERIAPASEQGQELQTTIKETPETVQNRINQTIQDLYTRGMLKRPYFHIQEEDDNESNPMTKRIRAMIARMAQRDPESYEEAINHPTNASGWRKAINIEIETLQGFNTWTEVPIKKGMKLVNTKFIFKTKPSTDGQPEKLKARLVAQGFRQIQGIDFHETYAPTPKPATTRIFFAIVCALDLKCRKVDATNAFAQAKIEEVVYLIPPPPLQKKGVAWKLNKALYGLRQASYAWRNKIVACLSRLGLIPCAEDECIMVDPNGGTMILIYVDDIAVAGSSESKINDLIAGIARTIGIKDMGELRSFLGMEITRNREKRKMWLTQTKYIEKMAIELDMAANRSRPIGAPISSWETLEPKRPEEKAADKGAYQSLIGTLMYPSVMTRPDISFATSYLSQHISDPAERHLDAAKRVARYLRDTASLGIEFDPSRLGGMDDFLVGYSDADYANSKDRKSISGMIFLLAGGPIQWKSQKQRSVATSTTESEYVGFTPCAKEGIWIRRLVKWCLETLKFENNLEQAAQTIKIREDTLIYGDNQAALKIAKNLGESSRTKHIDVQFHAIKDWIREGKIKLEYVTTDKMLADGLTKPLSVQKFNNFRSDINIRPISDQAEYSE
ncbi:Retrovirus-related Pol polyprotein from transposon TNT 1-94 [Ceratocystis lukuohia]|uniref:Retrovirus-related Pol polyprotein from transposon TNT 1-94 n=1 Tax=Ceratocystis lukuohia TaxID=2019550 RepID=A0ABR4MGR3_9PEZI